MKALRRFLSQQKPKFQRGGKFGAFQSTFNGIESFLFVPNHTTKSGSHLRDAIDLKRTMSVVVLALVPALLFGMYNVGYQHFLSVGELSSQSYLQLFWYGFLKVLPLILVSYIVGLGIEFFVAQKRGHEINEGYLVSGLLIPMIMPVEAPLWMVAVATAFAVILGKEVFGGTGMNIWNPALLARAFFFFAYPSKISGDAVWIADKADAFSGATPLADAAAATVVNGTSIQKMTEIAVNSVPSLSSMFYGLMPGSLGETSTLAILIGAVILIVTGIGSWRIMMSVFAGGMIMGLILNAFAVNPFMALPAWYHLVMGGFAFGAVFMATDPVTSSQTRKGKYIYGLLVGIFAVLIRVLNPAYPEGMMLAILLMNTFAPLIDYFVVQSNISKRLKRAKANI